MVSEANLTKYPGCMYLDVLSLTVCMSSLILIALHRVITGEVSLLWSAEEEEEQWK
jgi:hypothetical protein